jgi:hypothetical protein
MLFQRQVKIRWDNAVAVLASPRPPLMGLGGALEPCCSNGQSAANPERSRDIASEGYGEEGSKTVRRAAQAEYTV